MMNLLRLMISKIILGLYIIYEILVIVGVILVGSFCGLLGKIKERKERQKEKGNFSLVLHDRGAAKTDQQRILCALRIVLSAKISNWTIRSFRVDIR